MHFIINNKQMIYDTLVDFEKSSQSLSGKPRQNQIFVDVKEEISTIFSGERFIR